MANTLNALAPLLFSAAQSVASEPIGMLDSIANTFDDKGVALGDTVVVPVAPAATLDDFTPSNVPPTGAYATAQDVLVEIGASKKVSWNLTGEQQRSLENATIETEWIRQMLEQGMRSLRNQAEAAAIAAALTGASRATGTAGTNAFANAANNMNAIADVKQILLDQGTPQMDLSLVINTTSGNLMRKTGAYQYAYQAGSVEQLRQGNFLPQFGFVIRESAGMATTHTAGTIGAAGATVKTAASAGATSLTITGGSSTGDVALNAGDAIYFGSDTATIYVIPSHVTIAAGSDGTLTLNRPGLMKAVSQGAALHVLGSYTPNIALERSSVVGAVRPPIIPDNPTIQQIKISDPKSNLTFLMLDIAQYGQRTWELHLAYGFAAVQPAFICTLLG